MDCTLENLNKELNKYKLPPAQELIGRKFCFTAKSDGTFPARILVDSISAIEYEDDEEVIKLVPQSKSNPLFSDVAILLGDVLMDNFKHNCEMLIWGAIDDEDPHFNYQGGTFELLD